METYVILGTLTAPVGDAQAMQANMGKLNEAADKMGIKLTGFFMTLGRFDMVVVLNAPTAQTAAKFAMLLASTGMRTETLRAFKAEEALAML